MWEWHKRSLRVNTRLQRESAINTISNGEWLKTTRITYVLCTKRQHFVGIVHQINKLQVASHTYFVVFQNILGVAFFTLLEVQLCQSVNIIYIKKKQANLLLSGIKR